MGFIQFQACTSNLPDVVILTHRYMFHKPFLSL